TVELDDPLFCFLLFIAYDRPVFFPVIFAVSDPIFIPDLSFCFFKCFYISVIQRGHFIFFRLTAGTFALRQRHPRSADNKEHNFLFSSFIFLYYFLTAAVTLLSIVLPCLIISTACPVTHPNKEKPTTKTTPASITPSTMDRLTMILGITDAVNGSPKMRPAMLSPTTPPIKDPGSNPTSANKTSPAPIPIYNPFLAISPVSLAFVIFMYLLLVAFTVSVLNKALLMPVVNMLILNGFDLEIIRMFAKQVTCICVNAKKDRR